MKPIAPCLLSLLLLLPAAVPAARWSEPEIAGLVTRAEVDEISGLAASRTRPGHYWAINDSGNAAVLALLDGRGRFMGSVPAPVPNVDWEDLASFELDGRRYLLIADTGDNGGLRRELALQVLEEPRSLEQAPTLAWTVRFRWPDGPRDCEAVAVDPARGEILLVSKKRVPPELFRLPLRAEGLQVAELLGTLQGIPQPSAEDLARNPVYGRYRSQVTAADLGPDGRILAVLTYRAVHYLEREAGTGWAEALARPVQSLPMPWMPQAEAIAFSVDGRELRVASEQLPSPILRYRLKASGK
ncbi:hypothetical protein [Arenimonas fontis]|uniref:Phytase-like domain-containing protein n=1 Tax=Arenimonas fontis TaxID=2608255 RepID=A0A5B2ZDV1_9GAMM|nr:hypothetical protein [Arenimonas fontis]KAA2286217.1 hypothetical protein F0415_01600 [Arenimonas fontis]